MEGLVTNRITEAYSELVLCEEKEKEAIHKKLIYQKEFYDAKEEYRKNVAAMVEEIIEKEKQKGILLAREKNDDSVTEIGIRKRLVNIICHFLQSKI